MTKRIYDENGYLEVTDNPLTKEGVFPYLAKELGLTDRDPNAIVYVYRPAEEIEKAADSFKLQPLINEHEWLGEHGTAPEKKGILGTIGEQVYFDAPYLRGNIKIHGQIAQDLIHAGKIELSAGYKCDYAPESGTFNGKPYEFTQRGLRCNHLALVQEGRTGKDVAILDHSIITIDTAELLTMNMEELLAAIAALSEADKAKVQAALGQTADETKQPAKDAPEDGVDKTAAEEAVAAAEEATGVIAQASEAAAEAASTGSPEAIVSAEEAVEAAEEKLEEVKDNLDKAAMDSANRQLKLAKATVDSAKRLRKVESSAMDANAVIKMLGQRDSLVKRLIPHIGVFDHASMTIEQVAAYGCNKLGIKAEKGFERVALDAALQVRVADSAKPLAGEATRARESASIFWKE